MRWTGLSADRDRAPSDIQGQVPDPDHPGGIGGRSGRPTQQRVDPRAELGHAERLGHVVVGAEVEGRDLVRLAVAGRQDKDRRGRLATDLPDDRQAVLIRKPEVEHDEVRPSRRPGVERRRGVAGLDDIVVVSAEVGRDGVAGGGIVLDQQDRMRPRG